MQLYSSEVDVNFHTELQNNKIFLGLPIKDFSHLIGLVYQIFSKLILRLFCI